MSGGNQPYFFRFPFVEKVGTPLQQFLHGQRMHFNGIFCVWSWVWVRVRLFQPLERFKTMQWNVCCALKWCHFWSEKICSNWPYPRSTRWSFLFKPKNLHPYFLVKNIVVQSDLCCVTTHILAPKPKHHIFLARKFLAPKTELYLFSARKPI